MIRSRESERWRKREEGDNREVDGRREDNTKCESMTYSSLPSRTSASWQYECRRPRHTPSDAQSECACKIKSLRHHMYTI